MAPSPFRISTNMPPASSPSAVLTSTNATTPASARLAVSTSAARVARLWVDLDEVSETPPPLLVNDESPSDEEDDSRLFAGAVERRREEVEVGMPEEEGGSGGGWSTRDEDEDGIPGRAEPVGRILL